MRAGLAAAMTLFGLGVAAPLPAGVPNRCDLARIAARGAILSKYEELLSGLDRTISDAKANGEDPAHSAVADASGHIHSLDLVKLAAELDNQQQSDLGQANRQILKGCAEDADAIENAQRTAESLTALGISEVLAKYGISDDDLLRTSPPS
jgi:hypothetical protein